MMRTASRFQTPCETLRQINDLCQDDTDKDRTIRELLSKFEIMAKMLAKEINSRPGEKIGEKWWSRNKFDWRGLMRNRRSELYKTYSMEEVIKNYIVGIMREDSSHQSSCEFPGGECTCKKPEDIGYDTSLLRDGYIDSFTVEVIVVFLEDEFGVEIPAKEVIPENFDTINKMIDLIKRL